MNTSFRTAIVTGAGSGIGRACAQALLADGWRVALLGRRMATLQATAAQYPNDQVLCLPTDVSDPLSVQAAFDAVAQAWGRLDLLFNNAGVFTPGATPDAMSPTATFTKDGPSCWTKSLSAKSSCPKAASAWAMCAEWTHSTTICTLGTVATPVTTAWCAP